MEIQTTQTFKHVLQAKTLNAKKNKSYYQQYDINLLRAFHNQATMKQQLNKSMLVRKIGMDYSPGIQFQKSLIKMGEAK